MIVQVLVMAFVSTVVDSSVEPPEIATIATDISHWQANIVWPEVIQSGIEIVIHKATQGINYVDKSYAPRKEAARAAGLKYWGAYHFADGTNGAAQAQHFLRIAGDADFLAIDLEVNPTKNQTTVTTEVAEELARAICRKTGRFPLVYGSPNFLNNYLTRSRTLAMCPLWVANWRRYPPMVPRMWDRWVLWQYTNGEAGPGPHVVPGIGACDRDKVNTTAFTNYINNRSSNTM
uniref:Putative autolytic lysozyme n=3 Tax=Lygus hesperus TaxID=30085 RepID=A0A146LLA1_LYGHE